MESSCWQAHSHSSASEHTDTSCLNASAVVLPSLGRVFTQLYRVHTTPNGALKEEEG